MLLEMSGGVEDSVTVPQEPKPVSTGPSKSNPRDTPKNIENRDVGRLYTQHTAAASARSMDEQTVVHTGPQGMLPACKGAAS